MKKAVGIFILFGALVLSACGGTKGDIEVHEPWARPAMQGGNGGAYFMLHNHSTDADELLSASSDVADAVELHKSMMDDNGAMKMVPQDSVPLGADAEVAFAPGGLHVMLIGLKKDLAVGDTFDVVLHFKNHADITVAVMVMDDGGGMEMDMNSMDMETPTP